MASGWLISNGLLGVGGGETGSDGASSGGGGAEEVSTGGGANGVSTGGGVGFGGISPKFGGFRSGSLNFGGSGGVAEISFETSDFGSVSGLPNGEGGASAFDSSLSCGFDSCLNGGKSVETIVFIGSISSSFASATSSFTSGFGSSARGGGLATIVLNGSSGGIGRSLALATVVL